MSQCALAAHETLPDKSCALSSIQAQFLSGASPEKPITYTVRPLSSGRRFVVRLVLASQSQRTVVSATLTFATTAARSSPAMTYAIKRETTPNLDTITLNDLEPVTPIGPFMKFQRLPIIYSSSSSPDDARAHTPPRPETGTTLSAAHISPRLPRQSSHLIHTLGLLNLSDYHVLSTPLQLSNLTFGLPAPGDPARTPTRHTAKLFTSLNHAVYFHDLDGFRADEMCYVEGRSGWAGQGRAYVTTRIFGADGKLRASCAQEAYYVLDEAAVKSRI